jgi:hypothetical protein
VEQAHIYGSLLHGGGYEDEDAEDDEGAGHEESLHLASWSRVALVPAPPVDKRLSLIVNLWRRERDLTLEKACSTAKIFSKFYPSSLT